MTNLRGGLSGHLALSLAAAGTTWLAFFSWRGFTEQSARFLGPLLVIGAVVAGSGALARWSRVPAPLVVLGQLLLAGGLTSAMLCGSPVPVGPAWERLQLVFEDAVAAAQQHPAPVPATAGDGVHPLLIVGGLACLLLVDLLACTLRRAPLAGLPLLTVYSVPVSMLEGGVSWWVFALIAGGYLLMLFLQVNEQLTRWGRPLGTDAASDPSGFGVRTGAVRGNAAAIGGLTTAIAIVVPVLIPTLDLNVFEGGTGDGDGDITVENPMVDLRRDLQRGDDLPLIRVRTDDPDPSYLRIAVLNRFNDNEWTSGDREVPTNQLANGELPPLQGVAGTVAREEFRYDVTINSGFDSVWLPTQAPISRIEAPGDWRYDLATMDFLAGDEDLSTEDLSYSMTAVELDYDPETLARAGSSGGQVDSSFLDLPDGIPPEIANLANQVTRNADTRFEKAQVLQDWFRSEFTYDLDAEEGNGTDDLVRFLTEGEGGRTGYCEQFAASMAVLSRSLGIPARVAVGFLEPQRVTPGLWEYSSWDMHAWPELYFAGSGWVPFEPTPAGRAEQVPGYTTAEVPDFESPGAPGLPRDSDELPDRGDSEPAAPAEEDRAAADDETTTPFPWAGVVAGVGGVTLVVLVLLIPRTVRTGRARRRLGAGPEPAWAELRDTATDLGIPWPADRSPRETRDLLVGHLGAPLDDETPERPVHGPDVAPDAVSALDRIVLSLERARYARPEGDRSPALAAELATVVASLHGGASAGARRRAVWWPRSVVSLRSRGSRTAVAAPITVRHGGVVDHVG
jgi:transglutaminase-like putative cysteine protease